MQTLEFVYFVLCIILIGVSISLWLVPREETRAARRIIIVMFILFCTFIGLDVLLVKPWWNLVIDTVGAIMAAIYLGLTGNLINKNR